MREYYAKQDSDFVPYEDQLKQAATFEAQGLSNTQIMNYLATKDGQLYLDNCALRLPTYLVMRSSNEEWVSSHREVQFQK